MSHKISEDLVSLYETLLRAQLNALKQIKKELGLKETVLPREKRMSQMDMVYDILKEAQQPLHVDNIIDKVQRKFNVKLDKESVVSALAKRVKRQDRFIKTAPNTFALLYQDLEGGQP